MKWKKAGRFGNGKNPHTENFNQLVFESSTKALTPEQNKSKGERKYGGRLTLEITNAQSPHQTILYELV